jgi:6-phosphogluconate dehydrogenase (decarboxylating)
MQIGMIGLGRMGANMVRRLLQANHQDKLLSAMRFEFGGHREKSAN